MLQDGVVKVMLSELWDTPNCGRLSNLNECLLHFNWIGLFSNALKGKIKEGLKNVS